MFSVNFTKSRTKIYLRLYCNGDNSYLCVSKPQICKLQGLDFILLYLFYLLNVSKKCSVFEIKTFLLNGTKHNLQFDYISTDLRYILHIYGNLMKKHNVT